MRTNENTLFENGNNPFGTSHTGRPVLERAVVPTRGVTIACAIEIAEGVNFNSHKHMKSIMMPRLVALIFVIKTWIYFHFHFLRRPGRPGLRRGQGFQQRPQGRA